MATVNEHIDNAEERRLYWAALCPKKNVNAIAPRIYEKSQRVDVGSFVELHMKEPTCDKYRVVRIIDVDKSTRSSDTVTKWKCVVYDRFIGCQYQGSETEVVVGLGANVPELVMTDKVISISADDMRCIAFVFLLSELDKKAACLHGVVNGYFVRFRVKAEEKDLHEIPLNEWLSFPCESSTFRPTQSFVKTVFVSLDYIKHYLTRAANRCGDAQGEYPRCRFSDLLFSPVAWHYIKSRCFQLGSEEIELRSSVKKRKVSRLVTNVSISSVSFCMLETTEVLKFDNQNSLDVLEKILGVGSLWGFRHRRPKYGSRVVAQRNDTMNAVFGDGCYVELSFNKSANRLVITAQFDSFLFNFDKDGKLIECPCPRFEKYCARLGPDDPNNIKNAVVIGAYFRLDRRTYEIVNVVNGNVGPPLMSDAWIHARVQEGSDEGEVHEFFNRWTDIGNRVLAYYN